MRVSGRKAVAATLVGGVMMVATARSSEGQGSGRLQVTARVIPVGPQQEALTQARVAAGQLGSMIGNFEPLEARSGEGLIRLTVRRIHPARDPHSLEASAVASLIYIAN